MNKHMGGLMFALRTLLRPFLVAPFVIGLAQCLSPRSRPWE
jgi:hypothetical protein